MNFGSKRMAQNRHLLLKRNKLISDAVGLQRLQFFGCLTAPHFQCLADHSTARMSATHALEFTEQYGAPDERSCKARGVTKFHPANGYLILVSMIADLELRLIGMIPNGFHLEKPLSDIDAYPRWFDMSNALDRVECRADKQKLLVRGIRNEPTGHFRVSSATFKAHTHQQPARAMGA